MLKRGTASQARLPGVTNVAWRRAFRRSLHRWYARHARDLPWRASRDPYRVWVSEVMLQQTQVATAQRYFERFIAAFPTVSALASASDRAVLQRWEGLGYYRRARQMHAAARRIVDQHGGQFPRDLPALRCLPGIGRYTAGAILSIAFDARTPILEANSMRLLARLLAYGADPTRAAGQRHLWAVAEQLLPRRESGTFNQALMELGSQICTTRRPACPRCPVATLCAARAQNRQDTIPPPKARPRTVVVREAVVVVRRRGTVLLLQYGEGQRWAGLWDFPRFPIGARQATPLAAELVTKVKELTGTVVRPEGHITTIQHGVTRFRITLECHAAAYVGGRLRRGQAAAIAWVKRTDLERYPFSATGRRLVARFCLPAGRS